MCGIAGFVGEGDGADLRRMIAALEHRGPDAEGVFEDEALRVQLGHRRLSILDHASGAQPMSSRDRDLTVVFNGEIYNHAELRAELEKVGHRFVTDHSDTEVLLHAYREWGDAFVERLNGMWAFALLDRRQRRLLLSRDRFGQKPLYYAQPRRAGLVFASELSAVVEHRDCEATIDPESVRKYFAYGYVPAPRSIHRGIFKLPAGHNLVLDLGSLRAKVVRWWEFVLEPSERDPELAAAGWSEELRERLGTAVRRRLVADVPVGVFLSGGIDSSAIAALASQELPRGRLQTFAIGFEDASFDESDRAASAAAWVGSDHHCTTFSRDRLREVAGDVVRRLDEPMADSSLLPTFLLCGQARREVRVALGGDGADELFAGYDPFRALALAQLYSRVVPRTLHRGIRALAARLPTAHHNMSLDFKLKRTLAGLSHPAPLWNAAWLAPLDAGAISELLAEPVDEEALYSEAIEVWDACASDSLVDQTLQFYTRLYLSDGILTKVDRASMMHSLEVRSPFLDIDLVDFVRRLPTACKLRGGRTKFLLKQALAPLLPDEILHRPKKGFGVPIGDWFRHAELDFEGAACAAGTSATVRARLLDEHRRGRADHRLYLWSQWLLDHWAQERPGLA